MGVAEIISVIALVLSFFAFPAMWAVHKGRTQSIIMEEKPEILAAASVTAQALIKASAEEERSRAKEMFTPKHEMSEMRGLVNQLVHNTSKLDEKLDRMHELLLQLAKAR